MNKRLPLISNLTIATKKCAVTDYLCLNVNHITTCFKKVSCLFLLMTYVMLTRSFSQLPIGIPNPSVVIDFETTYSGILDGPFDGMPSPSSMPNMGNLDSDAWTFSGFNSASDLMRGTSTGGVTTGGVYAFNLGGTNIALGIQPAGSDFTPGSITLAVMNNGSSPIIEFDIDYDIYVLNNGSRGNSFNFEYSSDGITYTPVASLDFTSPVAADAIPLWMQNSMSTTSIPIALIPPGDPFYIRWLLNDDLGSGSRDEFALDNIQVAVCSTGMCPCSGDAGPDQLVTEGDPIIMAATAEEIGNWSGGAGMFSDATDPSATYTPDPSEAGTTVTLTWESSSGSMSCITNSYTTSVTIIEVPDAADAEFTYDLSMLCLKEGAVLPEHTTGVDGYYTYSVISGGPTLDIDSGTGTIQADNIVDGEYLVTNTITACGNLIITGIIDGTLPMGQPKALELYALADIADLSVYSLQNFNNGATTPTPNSLSNLPAVSLATGDYFYIVDTDDGNNEFLNFFGFEADFSADAISFNGDDVMVLYCNGVVMDHFGELGVDGSGEAWEYRDGWAYRNMDQSPNYGSFDATNWTFSGTDALDGATTNATATTPIPFGTFSNDNFVGIPDASEDFTVIINDLACTPTVVPTMGQWGLICLSLLLLIFGVKAVELRDVVLS